MNNKNMEKQNKNQKARGKRTTLDLGAMEQSYQKVIEGEIDSKELTAALRGKKANGSKSTSFSLKEETGRGRNDKRESFKESGGGRGKADTYSEFSKGKRKDKIKDKNKSVETNREREFNKKKPKKNVIGEPCIYRKTCGGCNCGDIPYKEQLQQKQKRLESLLSEFCAVKPIVGMEHPYHYRNKVHAVVSYEKGSIITGIYKEGTHTVIPVEYCLIEDIKADDIIASIRNLMKSFKMKAYDEDTGYGFLRHILIKRGFQTGEIMVVLVTASPIFPSKNNFVKALLKLHPDITTIIQNINDKHTSMVLGEREQVMYGKGYIEDILCGYVFRISSKSFYQINPVQTELLYKKAIELAQLTGTERIIDAYCGIGTIGIAASKYAKEVIGVELNKDAVKDAIANGKRNDIKNIEFYQSDSGQFMTKLAAEGTKIDVIILDPPRSGSTEEFMDAMAQLGPERIVYISCNPETLARDLKYMKKKGYKALGAYGYDLFPFTGHVESVILLNRKNI